MPSMQIYGWSLYTSSLSASERQTATHPNDPVSPVFDSGNQSWVGETFTFSGGSPTAIEIADDDGDFEDAYVETGGSQTLTAPITINGTTYPAGSVVQNEFSLSDASGTKVYIVRIGSDNVGVAYEFGDAPAPGEVFTIDSGLDGDPADNVGGAGTSTVAYGTVICFGAGTRLQTPGGTNPVEQLRVGDLVVTADRGAQPIQWIRRTEHHWTRDDHRHKPILIAKGALGEGLPYRDLVVSPQHRMLIPDGDRGMLAPAKGLTGLDGIRRMRGRRHITYYHLLLEHHAVIFAEGAPTESFFPGPQALRSLSADQCDEIRPILVRALRSTDGGFLPARPMLTVAATRDVVKSGCLAWAVSTLESHLGTASPRGTTQHAPPRRRAGASP
ncbi:MAG: Hint domain-containing protein [Paracoccaceae bacterium]